MYDIYPIKKAGQSVKSDTSSANSILPQNYKKSSGNAKYSLSPAELDKQYLSAVKNNDTETAQRIVDDVAKENGYTIKAYHGTSRGDRVGNVFLPERATSGPMAFFTDNREIYVGFGLEISITKMCRTRIHRLLNPPTM